MTASRVGWSILVPFCIWLALTAIVVMVRHNVTASDDEAGDVVVMESLSFRPATLNVGRGVEVLFDNKDVAPHTVTADDGSVDSGIIQPGGAFRLVPGESFTYFCAIHPAMTGEIRLGG